MDRPKEEDRELIEFKELYKSNAPMLIFYAGKYVNAIAAEDLVQPAGCASDPLFSK